LVNLNAGFDDSGDGVTFFELELVSAAACDDALNETVPDPNDNVSHDITELNVFDCSAQFVSS
jgi:hypothetical protein